MNKRFSTLLAGVLLAGSSFSAFGAGTTDNLTPSLEKYYQLTYDSKYVVIGKGEARDSMALWKATDIKSVEDLNETLWKVKFTPVKGNDGVIAYYKMSLYNKVGNRQLILSTADVKSGATFYKSPVAVIGTEGIAEWKITVAEFDALKSATNGIKGQDFRPITYIYSASADKTTRYRIAEKGGAIKLQGVESKDKQEGSSASGLEFPVESDVNLLVMAAASYANASNGSAYLLGADELNKKGNNGFKLSFSKDVVANKYKNPFSAFTLHAETKPVYSAAVYSGEYAEALAAVKEGYEQLDDLKAALKDYMDGVNEAIDYLTETGNTTAAKAAAGTLIPNQSDLNMAGEEIDKCLPILAASTDKESLPVLIGAAKTALATLSAVEIDKAKKLSADDKALVAYQEAAEAVSTAINELITDTKGCVNAVDAVMVAWMTAYNDGNTDPEFDEEESELDALKEVTKNFATTDSKSIGKLLTTLAGKAVKGEVKTASSKVTSSYPLAITDSLLSKKQAYLVVDTNYVANKEKYVTFTTATLVAAKPKISGTATDILVAPLGQPVNKYLFNLSTEVSDIATADSILIDTYAPAINATTGFYKAADGTVDYSTAARVVIRTLGNSREVSVATDLTTPDAAVKNTSISFAMPPFASFTEGEVFYVIGKTTPEKDAYRIMAKNGTANWVLVKESSLSPIVPAMQWFVKKANAATHTYTIANRDENKNLADGAIYVVDAAKRIYTTAAKDTFQVVTIADLKEDSKLGYKYLTDKEQALKSFVLTAKNYANPEPYFLSVDKDSALIATSDVTKAATLIVKTPTTKDTKLNDEELLTRDYNLVTVYNGDTCYLKSADNGQMVITKLANKNTLKFRNVNKKANEFEVYVGGAKKMSLNQDGLAVAVALGETTAYVFNLEEKVTDIYKNFNIEKVTNVIISLDGDAASKITAVKPFAVVKRTGLDLKAAATDNDFVLSLDSAYISREDNYRYAYYITKPIDPALNGSMDKKAYMVSYNDSIVAKRSNDTIQYSQDGLTRIGFVHAKRVDSDSLAISKVKPAAADTINIVENAGVTPATWAFAVEGDSYRIETATDANAKKYVSYLNGVLVLGNKEQAQLFDVTATDLTPTDNEKIATSAVTVMAGNGNVTINGAAGKNVVISNVLGQVIANTVLTSDQATVAAPAGVVVVAVDGEKAVKAIVK